MKTAVILCAGQYPTAEYPRYLLSSADILLCCDSAFSTWLRHNPSSTLPDAVIGDLDSLPKTLRERYAGIIHETPDQEENDQTKALRYLLEHYDGIDAIHILGATGKREDHTIGNLSLLMEYARLFGLDAMSTPSIDIVSDYSTAFALRDTADLYVGEGRTVSIFSPDNTLRIDSEGLQWPTSGVIFDNWWKATLNRATTDRITLRFSHPSLALIILP